MYFKIKKIALFYWYQLKNGLLHMLTANVINKAIGMICNMIITRFMTKGDYGIWSYILNIYSYLLLFTGLGLYSGALQFGSENVNTDKEYSIFSYALKKGVLIDTAIVILFLVASLFIKFSIPNATIYIRIFVPILLLDYILNLFQFLLRCEERIKEYALQLNINSLLSSVGICVGIRFGILGIIIGRYISVVVSIIIISIKIAPELKKMTHSISLRFDELREIWRYSLFTGASAALNGVLYLLDVSMIAMLMTDPVEVGSYKVSTLLPNALVFIPQSVVVSIVTKIIAHRNDKIWLKSSLKKTYFGLGMFNLFICAALNLFAPIIITILSGQQYLTSVPAFRILVIGYFISGTFRTISVNTLAALHRVTFNLIISITSIVSDILLNYFLITGFQSIGAAYATLSVEVITSVMAFTYLCKHIKKMDYIQEEQV